MALSSGSLLGPSRPIGGADVQLRSAARRLQRQGFGGAAEKLALQAESVRAARGGGISSYNDRIAGQDFEARGAQALNKIRIQRLMGSSSQRGSQPAPSQRGSQPAPSQPATSAPRTPNPVSSRPVAPTQVAIPGVGNISDIAQSASDARRRSMREELDRITGSTEPGNLSQMTPAAEEDYDAARAEAISTARSRSASESGTTRRSAIDEINAARRASGQKEFDVGGQELADMDVAQARAMSLINNQAALPQSKEAPPIPGDFTANQIQQIKALNRRAIEDGEPAVGAQSAKPKSAPRDKYGVTFIPVPGARSGRASSESPKDRARRMAEARKELSKQYSNPKWTEGTGFGALLNLLQNK